MQDLSSYISNPFANLGVATKAAEMKIEVWRTLEASRRKGNV